MATIVFRIALHCRSGAPQECNTFAGGIIRRSIIFRGKLTVSRKSHLSLAKVATDQNGVTLKSRHGDEISPAALLRGRRPSPLPSPSACRTVGANRYSPAKIKRSMALNVCLLGECRLSMLIWCRRTRISAANEARDRNNNTSADQIRLQASLIRQKHRAIRLQLLAN
jgi:hypothetical protein